VPHRLLPQERKKTPQARRGLAIHGFRAGGGGLQTRVAQLRVREGRPRLRRRPARRAQGTFRRSGSTCSHSFLPGVLASFFNRIL